MTSTFLHQAKAEDLLNAFTSAISGLGLSLKKIIQISMDGPNVNLKFLRDLKAYLAEPDNADSRKLIEFGTCGLHVVNGSFRTAHDKSGWNINKFLRVIYYFFKDFPSRRGDYIKSCNSDCFLSNFVQSVG